MNLLQRTGLVALVALAATIGLPPPATASEEVPFITTPDTVTVAMLQLAGVGADDFVLDLGSGDGRIVIIAARRFGARGLGVEIVPDLVARSRVAAQSAGVAGRARFVEQDLFATDLSPATVVTMYLLPEVNLQLRPRLLALAPGTRIVSHDWDLGDWAPDRQWVLPAPDKPIGREKLSRLYLWHVPAPVAGLWCGPGGARLALTQQYQAVRGRWIGPLPEASAPPEGPAAATARPGEQSQAIQGWLRGRTLDLHGQAGWQWSGRAEADRLDADRPAQGAGWRRAENANCG